MEQRRFWHESEIKKWLEEDFPDVISPNGQFILEGRADEIIHAINGYFTPGYMEISENAKYLRPEIDAIRKAYENKDYKTMGGAVEDFKLAVDWM